jgi:heavy metal sensor kinase
MFSDRLRPLRSHVAFRLTLWYSGIFIVSALLLFALSYYLLSMSLNRQDHEAIRMRLKELSAVFRAGGIEYLEKEATVERSFQRRGPFFVRLAGRDNRTLLLILPHQWGEFDVKVLERRSFVEENPWMRVPARRGGTFLEVASVHLMGDYVLQAGKSDEERKRILRHFRGTFTAVLLPVIFLGFLGGAFLAVRALKPVRHVINTIHSIITGRMDARAPTPETGDEMKELVVLFNAMVEKIEVLIRGMRNSLDNVAHDLRTPMTRLRGIAEMALRSEGGGTDAREALADCLEESERILKMLNTLMDISEAETGVIKLDLQRVEVAAAIEDVIDLYRYVAEEKGLGLHTKTPEDLQVVADPVRVRQVLGNLLDNAIKYTASGGRVDMEAERNGGTVSIRVRDTGMGIPPGDLDRIWDRLYRGDLSRSQKGLGLGLSLVKAVVHAHGGEVSVVSEPGRGSTFTVVIPAEAGETRSSGPGGDLSRL